MKEGKKIIIITGITLAVYLAIQYLLPYVIPFLIAYLLVHMLNPVIEAIRKKIPWKKTVIAAGVMVIFLSLCTMVFYYLYRILMGQVQKVAMNFDYYYDCFCGVIDQCCMIAEQKFGVQVDEIKTFVYAGMDEVTRQIRVYMIPGVVNYSVKYLKKLVRAAIFLIMLFVAVVLLMRDYDEMKEKLEKYTIYQHYHNITERMWKQGGMYMKAQISIIAIVMLLCTLGLWGLGNPYFLLLGIGIGLLDALPFIGTGSALIPIAAVMAFQKRFRLSLGYIGLFLLTYIVREFLEPRLIGGKLGIYPFVMIVVVYVGLYLYGPSGVILGPVTLLLIMEIWREIQGKTE